MDHTHHVVDLYRIPLPAPPGAEFSMFNHTLAGAIVLILAFSAMLMYAKPQQFSFLKYVWPISLILLGLHLAVYSDPEYWPSGYIGFAETMQHGEARQHKVYALLLVVLGGIELSRAIGWLRNEKWKYAFSVLAGFGALYLLVHEHTGEHLHHGDGVSHAAVLYQHIGYVVVGVAAVIARVLHDIGRLRGQWAPYIWPSLLMVIGFALIFYRE